MIKKLAILGCTGSIGKQSLDVCTAFPSRFKVVGMANKGEVEAFAEQIKKFNPRIACVFNEFEAEKIKPLLGAAKTEIIFGPEGLNKVATIADVDTVLVAVAGMVGLPPTIEAIKAKKNIALASKEVLVAAGHIVMSLAKENKVSIMPVDSEHSAILQCMQGNQKFIKKIVLTASGGPFFTKTPEQLAKVTLKDTLAHPTWKMGPKITVDSASLMNKGLEVIEAHHLFGINYDQIEVVIHPQSIIHSTTSICLV